VPVCGWVVVPRAAETESVREALSAMAGCEVVPAENAEVLLLVTSTESLAADNALRCRVEALQGVEALLLTFGEVDPSAGGGGKDGVLPVPDNRTDELP